VQVIQLATGATEEYDGTSWTTSPGSMATGKILSLAGAGTQSFISFSVWWILQDQVQDATEEWTGAGAPTTVTITAS
jgi:hypothetical protein